MEMERREREIDSPILVIRKLKRKVLVTRILLAGKV